MRILITGGAGFIGANLVAELVKEFEVGVIDDLSTGSADNLHVDAWFQKMGILEPDLQRVVGEFGPDVVVHLAAQSSVAVSLEDPERDWAANVEGTRRVAEAAVACGASRMISASSAAVYGEPAEEDLPLSETAQKMPTSPYGESKLAAEEVLAGVLVSTDVDFASFRFANVYGPMQDSEGEGGVVAVFSSILARGSAPTIYGTGKQTRDFIFVGDVVSAIKTAMLTGARLREGEPGGPAYNISTGREISVNTLAALLSPLAGYLGTAQYASARSGDIGRSSLNPDKARGVFAWDARVTLERGLQSTYDWFTARK